jgi:hypothetical protein
MSFYFAAPGVRESENKVVSNQVAKSVENKKIETKNLI